MNVSNTVRVSTSGGFTPTVLQDSLSFVTVTKLVDKTFNAEVKTVIYGLEKGEGRIFQATAHVNKAGNQRLETYIVNDGKEIEVVSPPSVGQVLRNEEIVLKLFVGGN